MLSFFRFAAIVFTTLTLVFFAMELRGDEKVSVDLAAIDAARGLSEAGLKYAVEFEQLSPHGNLKKSFSVQSKGEFGLATQTAPASQELVLLKRQQSLWQIYPKTNRSKLVSNSQLKTGMPSVAYIMTTAFATLYEVVSANRQGDEIWVDIKGESSQLLYPHVKLRLEGEKSLPVFAEFYSKDGLKQRTLEMSFENSHPKGSPNENSPFIRKMSIIDHVMEGRRYEVVYGPPAIDPSVTLDTFKKP